MSNWTYKAIKFRQYRINWQQEFSQKFFVGKRNFLQEYLEKFKKIKRISGGKDRLQPETHLCGVVLKTHGCKQKANTMTGAAVGLQQQNAMG